MASAIAKLAARKWPSMFLSLLKPAAPLSMDIKWNSNRTSINRVGRQTYTRTYPTLLVYPDGSTINIRYSEPRKIIKLPFDLNTLTDQEKHARLERKKPKQKVVIEEDIDDGFDSSKYLQLTKNRKS